jgi:hypothetical protein
MTLVYKKPMLGLSPCQRPVCPGCCVRGLTQTLAQQLGQSSRLFHLEPRRAVRRWSRRRAFCRDSSRRWLSKCSGCATSQQSGNKRSNDARLASTDTWREQPPVNGWFIHFAAYQPLQDWLFWTLNQYSLARPLMSLKIDASFDNGVFVSKQMSTLADRERVRLTVEQVHRAPARRQVIGPVEECRPRSLRAPTAAS